MSSLKDNISSEWIRTTGLFGHTPDRVRIMLYVEGDDDLPFWTKAVEQYQEKYDIIVTTNKCVNPDEGNGKSQLLTMSSLGSSKIVAVDADYDLIIDNYSEFTEMVRNSEYVVNTTWYSLENILMMKTTCVDLLEGMSRAMYGRFVRFLDRISSGEENSPTASFGCMLKDLNIQSKALAGVFSDIESSIEDEYSVMAMRLTEMGYQKKDVWKLMRGHNVWNTIVKPVEKRALERQIKSEIQRQKDYGAKVDKVEAMNNIGIECTVDEYVDRMLYERFEGQLFVPEETMRKLKLLLG